MYEVQRLLVPTDFSHHADDALVQAIEIAEQNGAEITLLHVDEFPVSPLGATAIADPAIDLYKERKRKFLQEAFVRLTDGMKGRKVRFRSMVLEGRAYKVIVEEAERWEYDLVVLATRGLTHLSPYLIGSTSERVVRFSRQPVLSVPNAPEFGGKVPSVLCATDFSPAGNVALPYALSIARRRNAVLYVHYVSDVERPESDQEIRRRVPNLEELHPLAGQVRVEYVFDRDVEPSNSIIRFAEDRDVGLIVMSTHGRKGLRRVYIGNNTAEVVRQSTRPVLTVTHPFHKKIFAHPVTEQQRVSLLNPDV
jgi:nucleotide-binding universal stress UspA family protein